MYLTDDERKGYGAAGLDKNVVVEKAAQLAKQNGN